MSIDPDVLTRAVVPVPVHPDRSVVRRNRLLDDHRRGRRGSILGGGRRLRLLNDDDRLALDLLGCALSLFDDDVVGRVFLDADVVSDVAIAGDDDLGALRLPRVAV